VGAVALFPGALGLTADGLDLIIQVKPIVNPHARLPLPCWLTQNLRTLKLSG